jgi:hypothetical protein
LGSGWFLGCGHGNESVKLRDQLHRIASHWAILRCCLRLCYGPTRRLPIAPSKARPSCGNLRVGGTMKHRLPTDVATPRTLSASCTGRLTPAFPPLAYILCVIHRRWQTALCFAPWRWRRALIPYGWQ